MADESTTLSWDELRASPDLSERFRHKQRSAVVVHHLRAMPDGRTEVWRVMERPGVPPACTRVGFFSEPEAASAELEKIRKRMESDGWNDVS